MVPETVVIWLKISGSILGSSIAVVFRPGGDPLLKLLQRFIIGTILGFIFSPIIIDSLGWPHTWDYWIASSCAGGLFSYLLLQFLFSQETADRIRRRISR